MTAQFCGLLPKNCTSQNKDIIDKFGILLVLNFGGYTCEKRFSRPQIVAELRQADVCIGQSRTISGVYKEDGISSRLSQLRTTKLTKKMSGIYFSKSYIADTIHFTERYQRIAKNENRYAILHI